MAWNSKDLIKLLKNDDEVKAAVINIVKEYYVNQKKQQKNHSLCEMPKTNITENKDFTIGEDDTIKALSEKIKRIEEEKEQLQEELKEEIRKKEQIIQNAEQQLIAKGKEIADKNSKIEEINTCINKQIKENQQYKKELEDTRTALENIQEKYGKLDEIYQLYLNLSSGVHRRLKRVLNPGEDACRSAEVFFAYGAQEGNIVALWDVINLNAQEYQDSGEIESLLNIFDYFFRIFKAVSFKQVEGYQPQVGTEFDERYHTRTQDSHVSGRIEKVILPGFTIGQNITKKPLVYVE